jgi:hypothetical protein
MRLRRPIRKRTARAPTDKIPVEVVEPSTCSPASWTDPLCSIFNVFELCGSTSNVDGNKQKTTEDSGGSSRGSSRGNANPDRAAALPPVLPPSSRKKRDRNTKENVQSSRQKSVSALTTAEAPSKKINSTGKSSKKNVSKAPSTNAKIGPGAKGGSGKYFAGRKRQLSSNTSLQLTLEGPSEPVSSVSDNSSTGSENGSSNDSSKSDESSSDSSDTDSSGSFSYTTDSEAETASSESGSVGGSSTDSAIVDKDLIALLSKRQPAPASPPSHQDTAEPCSPLPQPQPQKQEQELPAGPPPRKLRQRRFLGGHRGPSNLESAPAPKRREKGGRRASARQQT